VSLAILFVALADGMLGVTHDGAPSPRLPPPSTVPALYLAAHLAGQRAVEQAGDEPRDGRAVVLPLSYSRQHPDRGRGVAAHWGG
jgi:hypothetical protein